jgi:hypothetical protein
LAVITADGVLLPRMYNVQGETIEMRRNETLMPTMSQEECYVRRVQEGFQMEAIRGDDVLK